MGDILFGDELAQFQAALRARNLNPPKEVIADGKFYRCDVRSRNGKGDGTYIVFGDGTIPAGSICNWQDGLGNESWCYQPKGRQRTAHEDADAAKKVEEARKLHEVEVEAARKHAAEEARRLWDNAEPATAEHPYLKRKRIEPHGIRADGSATLIIPLWDAEGTIHTVQKIDASGEKRFLFGGTKKGNFYTIS